MDTTFKNCIIQAFAKLSAETNPIGNKRIWFVTATGIISGKISQKSKEHTCTPEIDKITEDFAENTTITNVREPDGFLRLFDVEIRTKDISQHFPKLVLFCDQVIGITLNPPIG